MVRAKFLGGEETAAEYLSGKVVMLSRDAERKVWKNGVGWKSAEVLGRFVR